jgi:hypothetical protein
MKGLLLILTTIVLSNFSYAQDSYNHKLKSDFNYLKDSSNNQIEFGCGYIGHYSENLYSIKRLIVKRQFELITQLLDSKIPSTKYLAAIALIQADKKNKFKLDSLTKTKIETTKKYVETISFCSGCIGYWNYSISSLLDKKSKLPFSKRTVDWINESLKTKIDD